MLGDAWELMNQAQRLEFREHPDVLTLIEAAGESPALP